MHSSIRSSQCLAIIVLIGLFAVFPAQSQNRNDSECQTLLNQSQQMILDLEKKLKLLQVELDSTKEACEVELKFERETSKVKLAAANEKLELRRVFTDTIRAVEKEKYLEMKTFLMDKAKRRWYESPYLWLAVGFISGVILDR